MSAPDRRSEPRLPVELNVQISGTDEFGGRFTQPAVARNISSRGALLTGIEHRLRSGDLIRIQHRNESARFRVVWASPSTTQAIKIAVQRIVAEPCLWEDELTTLDTTLPITSPRSH